MGWKDRFTFRDRHFTEHSVCGQTFRFFPNRVGLLHELAEVSKPIAKALAVLFSDKAGDISSRDKTVSQEGTIMREFSNEGINPELARLRGEERDKAVEALLDACTDPRNRILVGSLLMDSLRDEFPYSRARSPKEIEEFMNGDGEGYEGLDTVAFAAMITGWVRANAKVFGAAGEQVAAAVGQRLGGLKNASRSETPEQTSGSDSKTPSSEPFSPASSSIE